MESITSPNNPRFKQALSLHTARGRQKHQLIIVFGLREFSRAIQAGVSFVEVFVDEEQLTPEKKLNLERLLARQSGTAETRSIVLSGPLFAKLAYGDRNVEVIAIAERPATTLARLRPGKQALFVILESIEKPGNLGAIARSADGSGAEGLLIADALSDIFHPNAIRSSVATVFSVPLAVGSSSEIRTWLLAHDFRILVATPEAEKTLYGTDLTGRVAIVFGNEAKGLSELWRTGDGAGVKLPMLGIGDSLNVSVTASLMMYEMRRQRNQS